MAGTIICDTLNTATPASGAGSVLTTNNAYLGIAKAWVYYTTNGSGASINSSFNVISITYAATGVWTINFTTAMPTANYVVYNHCSQPGVTSYSNGTLATSNYTWNTLTTAFAGYNPSSGTAMFSAVFSS